MSVKKVLKKMKFTQKGTQKSDFTQKSALKSEFTQKKGSNKTKVICADLLDFVCD